MSRILLIEDDLDAAEEIIASLSSFGHQVWHADGRANFGDLADLEELELFLVDLSLPDCDGLSLVREIQQRFPGRGVIIVSGRASDVDRIVGLELGADDYIAKPFNARELIARCGAVLRRLHNREPEVATPTATLSEASRPKLCFGGFVLDRHMRSLTREDGSKVDLTSSEYLLLIAFVERPRRVQSREALIQAVHGVGWDGFDRAIDGLVYRLRAKLGAGGDLIRTVRGAGYILACEVAPAP